jgi:hypothetical protein
MTLRWVCEMARLLPVFQADAFQKRQRSQRLCILKIIPN